MSSVKSGIVKSQMVAAVLACLVAGGCTSNDNKAPSSTESSASQSASESPSASSEDVKAPKKDHKPADIGDGTPLSEGDREAVRMATGSLSEVSCALRGDSWTAKATVTNTHEDALAYTLTFRIQTTEDQKVLSAESQTVSIEAGKAEVLRFTELGNAPSDGIACVPTVSASTAG